MVGCLDEFVKYSNTHAFRGTGVSTATTVESCREVCLSRQNCTAFDYSANASPRCYLHFTRVDRYPAGDTDHYERTPCERIATTNTRCQDDFETLTDRHGYGGTIQERIIDLSTCLFECNANPDCIAVDFDRPQTECYHFVSGSYVLDPNPAPGVEHRIRRFTCGTTIITGRPTLQTPGR